MSNRWKMNRIGFVNFWLYDEETFSFADGKLLLRGQNGSGKSITTQSFIPFILDGDRTPSRLDPFGSSDRKMEYYFLGEEGKDESTGYLFLEFKKENTEQYRTIGIGQRAQRGKPMGFWGFVITDGRRIGYDLWLYQEVGNTKIPYSKQELKKYLGENVPFTDMPGEYKAMVNKYIFGFKRMEQYEQFIRLLVKVRAPKLSKEFKPTKVYEILNESLQTLTDEDLRAMVDAMEKMDDIQVTLDKLREAYKDVQIIRTEYTRYNQFMIARKASSYLEEKGEVERRQAKLEAQEQLQKEQEQERTEKKDRYDRLEQERRLTDAEIESIGETDLEKIGEKLKNDREKRKEAEQERQEWERKIEQSRERIRESDAALRSIRSDRETVELQLEQDRQELEEWQETLEFPSHGQVISLIGKGNSNFPEELFSELKELKRRILEGQRALEEQEEADKRYDLAAQELAGCRAEEERKQKLLEEAGQREEACRDALIERYYEMAKTCRELPLSKETLEKLEQEVTAYRGTDGAGRIGRLLEDCKEARRKELRSLLEKEEQNERRQKEALEEKQSELSALQEKKELEPMRKALTEETRRKLLEAGIRFIPFYQAVEFAQGLSEDACNVLEAQLTDAGLLDALVVAQEDQQRMLEQFPQFSDVMIRVRGNGGSGFSKLVANEELEEGLKEETGRILDRIFENDRENNAEGVDADDPAAADRAGSRAGLSLVLNADGSFRNGILQGHSVAGQEAEFVGRLARQRKRERQIAMLEEQIGQLKTELLGIRELVRGLEKRLEVLEAEFQSAPDFNALNSALEELEHLEWYYRQAQELRKKAEKREQELLVEKRRCYQKVLLSCKNLPYARTREDFRLAAEALEGYQEEWQRAREELRILEQCRTKEVSEQDKIDREEEAIDTADLSRRRAANRMEELDVGIRKAQEYLNRPENREKAEQLLRLKDLKKAQDEESKKLYGEIAVLEKQIETLKNGREEQREELTRRIVREVRLRACFEEELALGLIVERGSRTITECAKEAVKVLRDSDKGRSALELTTALMRVYQQHNSSLTSYGTALEDCFEEEADSTILRKRQRIVSTWNGKKLYLENFYGTLKNRIEETELLILQKDRELFEDILSKTLSQQLTERIAESRRWISDMSALMKKMDTSMGLSFSLDWKPKSAETQQELDTQELEKLLLRDKELLTDEDMERVAAHFRSKIRTEKQKAEEDGGMVNYMDLVRDALDYRKWFDFQMFFYRNQEGKKTLTDAAFNKFSGGEKAMAMYVPLFAAVNAQYQKADYRDHPRIIALDEAFAGVDDKNISSMFELVERLDFDYIMNSQALWGCHETVPALRISELLRPLNSQVITVIHYTWNGHERILDEQ